MIFDNKPDPKYVAYDEAVEAAWNEFTATAQRLEAEMDEARVKREARVVAARAALHKELGIR